MLIIQPTTATVPGKHENLLLNARAAGEFRTDQLLEATILSNSRDGLVKLRIGNTELMAHTNVALPKNAQLELKVMQLQPQLLLKILTSTDSAAQIARNALNQPLRQAMLTLLPRQSSPLPVLSTIAQPGVASMLATELPNLQPLIRQLMNALPSRKDMAQPAGLKQAILQSGLFYEARLASRNLDHSLELGPDIKAVLARLHASIERTRTRQPPIQSATSAPTTAAASTVTSMLNASAQDLVPPPLRGSLPAIHPNMRNAHEIMKSELQSDIGVLPRKIEAALSRISLLQLATAENFNQGHMLWQLEIPVRHADSVDMVALTIEHDQQRKPEDEAFWTVDLALDLPRLGALHIHVSLNQEGIHSSFRTQSPASMELIESRFSKLKESLEQQGLSVQSLNCRTETGPDHADLPNTLPLIDEQA